MKDELTKLYDSLTLPADADERIRQTLLLRGASEQEVIPMKRKKHPIRTLLIAAALVAVLAAVAAAVSQTSFKLDIVQANLAAADSLQSALGDRIAGQEAYTRELLDADGNVAKTETYPAIERVALDEEKAEALLGDYVYAGTESITLDGCELTIAGFMLDENGIGIVTVDIDFPSADTVPAAERECLRFYAGALKDGETVRLNESNSPAALSMLDSHSFRDETLSTDTHIRYVCYITPFDCADGVGDIVISFCLPGANYDDTTDEYTGEGEWYIALSAPALIPAQHYSGDGFEAWVSPIGMKLETAGAGEYVPSTLALRYADDSEYTMQAEGVENIAVSSLCGGLDHRFYAFNRLADTSTLASIELDGVTLTAAE